MLLFHASLHSLPEACAYLYLFAFVAAYNNYFKGFFLVHLYIVNRGLYPRTITDGHRVLHYILADGLWVQRPGFYFDKHCYCAGGYKIRSLIAIVSYHSGHFYYLVLLHHYLLFLFSCMLSFILEPAISSSPFSLQVTETGIV